MRSLTQGDAQTDTHCCNRQPLSKPVSGALPTRARQYFSYFAFSARDPGDAIASMSLAQSSGSGGSGRGFVALGCAEVR
jgi:hypothetical protein